MASGVCGISRAQLRCAGRRIHAKNKQTQNCTEIHQIVILCVCVYGYAVLVFTVKIAKCTSLAGYIAAACLLFATFAFIIYLLFVVAADRRLSGTLAHSECNADDTFSSSNSATVPSICVFIIYLFREKNANKGQNESKTKTTINGRSTARTHSRVYTISMQSTAINIRCISLSAQRLFAFAFFTVNRYYCSIHFPSITRSMAQPNGKRKTNCNAQTK